MCATPFVSAFALYSDMMTKYVQSHFGFVCAPLCESMSSTCFFRSSALVWGYLRCRFTAVLNHLCLHTSCFKPDGPGEVDSQKICGSKIWKIGAFSAIACAGLCLFGRWENQTELFLPLSVRVGMLILNRRPSLCEAE